MVPIIKVFSKLIFFSTAIIFTQSLSEENDTLVLLHVLFRHGNRTPDKGSLFPNDLYLSETYEPFGYSQLTTKGKQTEYNIGKYIRENYGDFIPQQYTPDLIEALSTNWKRTKMSLQSVLTGLFPPLFNEKIAFGLNWQPIPYNVEEGAGMIGAANVYCATYISEYYSYVLSEDAQKICDDYKNLYEELSQFSGKNVLVPRDVLNIFATLKSEEDYGLALPDWSAGLYPQVLEEAGSVDYEFSTASPSMKKFTAGFLLKKILEDSLAKQNGILPQERKIYLYSAHEFNVATMLRTLNVFYRHVPPFGATIYFEIHNINGEYGLKLFYQDYKQEKPRLLAIPGCTSFCKLQEVYSLVQDFLPEEEDVCSSILELN